MNDQSNQDFNTDLLPPEKVRILKVSTETWPDKVRLRIMVEMTPFQNRPDIEAVIMDLQDRPVSKITIIENMETKLVFTMHLRVKEPEEQYRLSVKIMYREIGCVDEYHSNIFIGS